MDRASQLKNVAFGGAWSQQIPRKEKWAAAIALLKRAADRSLDEDLRGDKDTLDAFDMLCDANPKGDAIRQAWGRALDIHEPSRRHAEISRLVRLIDAWVSA